MSLVITNNTIDKYFGFLSRLDIISQKIRYIPKIHSKRAWGLFVLSALDYAGK